MFSLIYGILLLNVKSTAKADDRKTENQIGGEDEKVNIREGENRW